MKITKSWTDASTEALELKKLEQALTKNQAYSQAYIGRQSQCFASGYRSKLNTALPGRKERIAALKVNVVNLETSIRLTINITRNRNI